MPEYIQDAWPEQGTFCWGCGKNNEHGLHLKSHWEDNETVAVWKPKEHHMAFPGIMNGGIIATLIDCHGTGTANAAAHRASENLPQHFMFVTSGLSVRFLRPTPLNRPVMLKAQVKDFSDRKITVSCELYSGDMKCATGEVTTVRVDIDRFLQ
ncbi:MAG: PaaI family thioesterase [Candidatus Thorarchaeota archaeon]|nr:PaaI family thioesterase [Candidatus Thorarchaeota archaeon]